VRKAIFAVTEAGAGLLLLAQFLTLYHTRISATAVTVGSASVGSDHSWSVLLIGLMAALFGASLMVNPHRFSLLLVGLLGLLALIIALTHDLPDARSHGLGLVDNQYQGARNVVALGLYVEIGGALVLMWAAALGFLLGGDALTPLPRAPRRQRRGRRDTRGRRPPRPQAEASAKRVGN
jgi:hypothetical protein